MSGLACAAELLPGDVVNLTLRGVKAADQEVNGEYTVDDNGMIRLPLLEKPRPAAGLSPAGFARAAEAAYREAGIYSNPAIEVVANKAVEAEGAVLSVGGRVRRAGQVPFRKGMTVLQALDAAGGCDEFAGRNIMLIRGGKQYCLDFKKLDHKNLQVRQGDSLQVEMRPALLDKWKGSEQALKGLE